MISIFVFPFVCVKIKQTQPIGMVSHLEKNFDGHVSTCRTNIYFYFLFLNNSAKMACYTLPLTIFISNQSIIFLSSTSLTPNIYFPRIEFHKRSNVIIRGIDYKNGNSKQNITSQ